MLSEPSEHGGADLEIVLAAALNGVKVAQKALNGWVEEATMYEPPLASRNNGWVGGLASTGEPSVIPFVAALIQSGQAR